jgi:hypothetical protein
MAYNHQDIEKKWQEYWRKNKTFKAYNKSEKPKFYVVWLKLMIMQNMLFRIMLAEDFPYYHL